MVRSTHFQFNYNGDGARLRQIIAGVPTTYAQDLAALLPVVLQSKTGTDAMQYVYALGTRPLAQYGTAWEYLLADARPCPTLHRSVGGPLGVGSVRQIVDGSGNVLSSNGTASSIFGYSGEQIDTRGLVFLRARYMQPTLGIFLARDPWSGDQMRPGSMNGWNYGDDNPANQVDPTGRFSAVAIANGLYNQPTIVGFDRVEGAFSTMSRHLGWISLLLDADDSQYVYNWSNLTHREPYGKIKCDEDGHSITRVNEPYTAWRTATDLTLFNTNKIPRPRPELGRWWRDNGVYSLVNGSEEKFYFDKGDDGHTSDLPDFQLMLAGSVGSSVTGNAATMQDRFGKVYGHAAPGLSASLVPFSVFFGEGYVFHGNIWNVSSSYLANEKELEKAMGGVALSLSAALLIGPTININVCDNYLDRGPCYGAMIYTSGLQVGAGVTFGPTFGPTALKPEEAWDWMFYEAGPTRDEVWHRWLKSATENPCGICSSTK